MRGVFSPRGAGSGPVKFGELLATFNGFGAERKGREGFLDAMQRVGLVSAEQRTGVAGALAASPATAGSGAAAAAEAAQLAPNLGFAAAAPAAAAAGAVGVPVNPIYQGLLAQQLIREQGLVVPMQTGAAFAAAGGGAAAAPVVAAPAATEAAEVAVKAASAADDAASTVAALERSMLESFQRIGALDDAARLSVLSGAVDARAARGAGETAVEVLTRSIAAGPLEHAAPALEESLERVLTGAAAAAAAKVAPEAAVVAKAAPEVATVAAKAAPALAKAVPIADDAARAVGIIASSGGGTRLMGMGAGILEALRLVR